MADEGFLSRWARRKAADRQGVALPEPEAVRRPVAAPSGAAAPASVTAPSTASGTAAATMPPALEPAAEPPALTLDDVAGLCPADDFAPFVARGVPAEVKAAAMKKLFADPHYNIMDGLDIYIDDYTKSDPIPLAMLKQLHQSKVLRLFESDDEAQPVEVGGQASTLPAPAARGTDPETAAGVADPSPQNAPDPVDSAAPQERPAPETRADAATRDIIGANDPAQNPDRHT